MTIGEAGQRSTDILGPTQVVRVACTEPIASVPSSCLATDAPDGGSDGGVPAPSQDRIADPAGPQSNPPHDILGPRGGPGTDDSGAISCFTRDTRIETPNGSTAMRDLRPGDLVSTLNHGCQQVLWINRTRLSRADLETHPEHRPIRIARGALGQSLPQREWIVSPQLRIAITAPSLRSRFGSARVLVPATALLNGDSIAALPANRGWSYFHLMLSAHSLIVAEGCVTESLSPREADILRVPERFDDLPLWSDAPPLPALSNDQAREIWAGLRASSLTRRALATAGSPHETPRHRSARLRRNA